MNIFYILGPIAFAKKLLRTTGTVAYKWSKKYCMRFLNAHVEVLMLKRWKDSSRSLSGNISCMSAVEANRRASFSSPMVVSQNLVSFLPRLHFK